ncbi:MAG: DUF1015 domain-containing protein [Desulfuromonadaceae bacterium]|nr:DUF1015 domain-containing protein [Desulfuromonas sp.]MDY0184822.1 DUF1015 domain-containing protein [Desulfuromonadaceae bacterium]
MNFPRIALQVPRILLPAANIDMHKWAVIACDQYTSDLQYWNDLAKFVGSAPSTLKMTLPEVYLEDPDVESRIEHINANMHACMQDGTLVEHEPAFVLVERSTAIVPQRKGLMVALDLECYDYNQGAHSLIRATEGTIMDRLPPRIKVRRNAPLELPHIMVLIDDPHKTVIEPLFDAKLKQIYNFYLYGAGGHLNGYLVDDPKLHQQVVQALDVLADPQVYQRKYPGHEDVMLYAMGDGNHSFATAKALWEEIKRGASDPDAVMEHPARYALVELVNIHDSGLEFEAIHRVLFNVDVDDLRQELQRFFSADNMEFELEPQADADACLTAMSAAEGESDHCCGCVLSGSYYLLRIRNPHKTLAVGSLQEFLDGYLARHEDVRIDYIHGVQSVTQIGSRPVCAGFYLPSISKHDFFRTIVQDGALPRKTFSMGEADEKRFYLEGRTIIENP